MAATARHQRLGPPIEHVVHLQKVAAPDLEDVPKSLGRDEPGARALPLEQRVDADGRAVNDEPTVGQPHAGLVHAAQDALEELARRAERLGGDHGTRRFVERDEIRERATDVDADSQGHASSLPGKYGSAVERFAARAVGTLAASAPR